MGKKKGTIETVPLPMDFLCDSAVKKP